jgi:hypothetical protein
LTGPSQATGPWSVSNLAAVWQNCGFFVALNHPLQQYVTVS